MERLGTDRLGTFFSTGGASQFWRTGVEIVGIVEPNDFVSTIEFKRTVDFRGYRDMTLIDSRTFTETPSASNTDSDPQSGDSAGKVYNVDAPGITGSGFVGTIYRMRTNFCQWAEFEGKRVSDDLEWFSRISMIKTSGRDELRNDIPGDNIAGPGTTKLTWNLR
jgi:hypothetical protein